MVDGRDDDDGRGRVHRYNHGLENWLERENAIQAEGATVKDFPCCRQRIYWCGSPCVKD